MAPGGPSNLKQKRSFVSRTTIKELLNKEKGIVGQHDTVNQKLNGGANISNNQNTRCQASQNHLTIEDENTLPNLASRATEIPRNETTEIPPTESVQHASSEDIAATTATGSKKRTRGQTTGKGILRYFDRFGKMKINVDPELGRPKIGEESAKLASNIGMITQNVLTMPKKWKEVDEGNGLRPAFDHLQIHMDVNIDQPGVKQSLVNMIRNSTRQKRYKWHKHFRQYATLQEAKNNKPTFCPSKENWEELCNYFATEKFKHVSTVNQTNRQKLRCKHITGRKAFTVRAHEISERELAGTPCDRIDLYERTHSSEKDGWKSNEAKENWEMMNKKREEYIELGIEKTSAEIVLEVLGHGTGYVKGYGYGPKPPSRRNTLYDSSNQLQKDLQGAQEELQVSKSQVNELKTEVTVLKDQLAEQGAEMTDLKDQLSSQSENINKLMSFLNSKGMEF